MTQNAVPGVANRQIAMNEPIETTIATSLGEMLVVRRANRISRFLKFLFGSMFSPSL